MKPRPTSRRTAVIVASAPSKPEILSTTKSVRNTTVYPLFGKKTVIMVKS